MTLLEILVQELSEWPAGRECAYQSTSFSEVYFDSPIEGDELKIMKFSRNASDRGPSNRVTRGEWEVAKIKSLPFFPEVAAILGEAKAVMNLLTVGEIDYKAKELDEAFVFEDTPQGYDFWVNICDSSEDSELKVALDTITAAMKEFDPKQYIRIRPDGSGSVRGEADKVIFYFTCTDELVDEYLSPTPKFDYWGSLQDRFQWIAKDLDGSWWAYENRPTLESDGVWDAWDATEGDYHSLGAVKVDIPCHWKRSLIERPTSQGEIE